MSTLPIFISGNDGLTLEPLDFLNAAVLHHFTSAQDRRLYALLRAFGHPALESFIRAFGKTFIGRPDELARAAEHFENTQSFKREFRNAAEDAGQQRVKRELKRRCEEVIGSTYDAALQLRVELHDFKPAPNEHRAAADEQAFEEFAKQRRAADFREQHTAGNAAFLGDHQPSQYNYEERTYG
jgi:hypothetical protein